MLAWFDHLNRDTILAVRHIGEEHRCRSPSCRRVLLTAGLQACYWPARRAARVDPIVALRQE